MGERDNLDGDDEGVLDSLERRVGKDPQFTLAEREMLRDILQVYRGIKGLGTIAKIITLSAATVAAGMALWDEFLKRLFQ